jgi:hypothetical protein
MRHKIHGSSLCRFDLFLAQEVLAHRLRFRVGWHGAGRDDKDAEKIGESANAHVTKKKWNASECNAAVAAFFEKPQKTMSESRQIQTCA